MIYIFSIFFFNLCLFYLLSLVFLETGDESWFYWIQVGRKQSNKSWIGEGESPKTVVRQGRFDSKTMVIVFFRTSGVEQITYWGKGDNVDDKSYVEDC